MNIMIVFKMIVLTHCPFISRAGGTPHHELHFRDVGGRMSSPPNRLKPIVLTIIPPPERPGILEYLRRLSFQGLGYAPSQILCLGELNSTFWPITGHNRNPATRHAARGNVFPIGDSECHRRTINNLPIARRKITFRVKWHF
jgi:hypothetical protein